MFPFLYLRGQCWASDTLTFSDRENVTRVTLFSVCDAPFASTLLLPKYSDTLGVRAAWYLLYSQAGVLVLTAALPVPHTPWHVDCPILSHQLKTPASIFFSNTAMKKCIFSSWGMDSWRIVISARHSWWSLRRKDEHTKLFCIGCTMQRFKTITCLPQSWAEHGICY